MARQKKRKENIRLHADPTRQRQGKARAPLHPNPTTTTNHPRPDKITNSAKKKRRKVGFIKNVFEKRRMKESLFLFFLKKNVHAV
jgi:hypothetical protein